MQGVLYVPRVEVFVLFVLEAVLVGAIRTIGEELIQSPSSTKGDAEGFTVMLFETEPALAPLGWRLYDDAIDSGFDFRMLGLFQNYTGWSSKYRFAMPELRKLKDDHLVVLSDYRDVLMNAKSESKTDFAKRFKAKFRNLTSNYPGAVIVSAEAQCCVAALDRVGPGKAISADGSRTARFCYTGQGDCVLNGTESGISQEWKNFMTQVAIERGVDSEYKYLNAGLIAGEAKDLINLIELANPEDTEDDQALLTEVMFRRPSMLLLDYNQSLFGNARAPLKARGCRFVFDQVGILTNTDTHSAPMFLHTSGGFYKCLNKLASVLGDPESLACPERCMRAHGVENGTCYDCVSSSGWCGRGKPFCGLGGSDCFACKAVTLLASQHSREWILSVYGTGYRRQMRPQRTQLFLESSKKVEHIHPKRPAEWDA